MPSHDQNKPLVATTRKQIADVFGVSLAAVAKWVQDGMPGRPGDYSLREIVAWLRRRTKYTGAFDEDAASGEGDAGGDSPALERQRLARAKLLELDLEERRGTVVHRDAIQASMLVVAKRIRKAAERLRMVYGNAAGDIIDGALDEADRDFDALPDADGEGSSSAIHEGLPRASPEDDGPVRA